jgi:hypothetical protein
MRIVSLICLLLLILYMPAASQNLYFTIIDSLYFTPRSLSAADFDGDSLDELFVGTDTGLVIINPRTHLPLWHSAMLRERVSASGFFDINGDGYKEILIGTQLNGFWLNIFYGPDYSDSHRWGGYFPTKITGIYNGVLPDSINIIVSTSQLLYSINPSTWDYACISGTGPIQSSRFLTQVKCEYGVSGAYSFAKGTFYVMNSQLINIFQTIIFIQYFYARDPSRYYNYGAIFGNFENSGQYVVACGDSIPGVFFSRFNAQFGLINTFIDSTVFACPNLLWMFSDDLDNNGYDEVYTFTIYYNNIVIRQYCGSPFSRTAEIDYSLPAVNKIADAHILSATSKEILLYSYDWLFIATLTNHPVSVNSEFDSNPSSFFISAYPNPFNSDLSFAVKGITSTELRVNIYNILGQLIDNIYDDRPGANSISFHWDSSDAISGVYFICAETGNQRITKKVTLLK